MISKKEIDAWKKCLDEAVKLRDEIYFPERVKKESPKAEIQYYWHCSLCSSYHLMDADCPFDRTADDQNNICPTCGKRIITTFPSIACKH